MSIFGDLWDDGKKLVGDGVNDTAHLVGDGLNAIGLHGAAQWADTEGTKLGYDLGADIPELQLGQTTNPAELVHGNSFAIQSAASRLREFSQAFGETAAGMRRLDTAHWTGAAADAFRAKFAVQPSRWTAAEDATGEAARALQSYAGAVESAQNQARQAIDLYAEGQQATAAALSAYNQQVAAYDTAARAYDKRLAVGPPPVTRPTAPGAFADPGDLLRAQAQQILAEARSSRNAAAASAAAKISTAADLAPAEPSFWSRVGDDLSDTFQAENLADISFSGGVLQGAAGIVKFARSVNPEDGWNTEHPAEYAAGMSGTLSGLAGAMLNPEDLAKSLPGSGWTSDPAAAFGRLVPNIALAIATDGGGTAAEAGASAAEDVGESAAADSENAAEDGYRNFASNGEAAAYGVRNWAAPKEQLISGEREALWGYSGEKLPGDAGIPDYKDINGYLRGVSPSSPEVTFSIGQIDQALAKGATREGIQVVRETGLGAFDRPVFNLVGTVQRDPGYLSTALGPDPTFNPDAPAVVQLNVPEGTPAMYMEGVSQFSGERELLIGRGLSYVVTKVQLVAGRYHIYGTVLS